MSDWEDEPSNAVASQVDKFDGAQPKSNDVGEWSDCEENNDNGGDDKGDNKTCYRARRDDGGNGVRERRNNGEAGFRGHRHKDNEGVPELFSRFSTGLQLPLTYDKESVEAFIKLPNINDLNMALAKLRKQRDFLQAAFKKLVDNVWEIQETSQRAKRKQKAIDLRDAVLKSDRIISEINQLIFERDDEQQPNVNWLISSYFTDSFVVPGTPNGHLAQEESNPTAAAARVTRTPAQPQRVASIRNAPSEQDIDRLRRLLRKVGLNYEETYDSSEVPEIIRELEDLEVSLNQQVSFVFHRCISEEVTNLHSMRKMSCLPHQQLREIKVWPIVKHNSIWFSNMMCKPHLLIKLVDGVKHLQMEQVDVGTSGQINFPRQELSENLVTPDYVGLAMDNQHSTVQENETTPSGAIATTPNHSVPSQPLITLAQGNLSQEDAYLMPPPHLPLELETDSAVHSSSNELSLDDNISASTIVRSRIAKPPTPLQSYRHQLPAINEELQMRSSAGRVLEMSEPPLLQTPNTTLPDFAVPYTTPSQRDWSSIFRPRTFAPNYLEDNVPVPKVKRRRRIYERNTLNVNEPVQSRSNQEITTAFVTELLQAAVRDGEDMSTANVTQQHITDETPLITPQVMDNTPPELIQMNLPTFCSDNLPDRPIVTSIEIIRPPESVSLCGGQENHTIESSTSNVTQAMITPSTRLIDDSMSNANDTPQQPQQKQECIQERLYGNNIEDLKFIIKHDNLLRLMVDNYRQVVAEQVQANLIIDGNPRNGTELAKPKEGGRPHYVSIPALYTYDPIIVKDMPALKRSVAHSLICALVMQPRVDMRSVAFIKTRMEAAIAFRILLELKAANLINISKDGYTSSLC
ncbi:sister chromatid cohesion protein solo isoform X1 [Drosophila sulfurigaster albostrigata]|uniref:sister chromatid cohesion protein solo isoform X1 n=1 Tax=Drosophila sulfurigaster albostrigata TaxID=89887 RepID=UPI002D21ED24|nr:sister chromatid cohesion protein solo isoform X1 [Drosophila sulfurigaster albostrigata]XP_062142942.1 sister chromatid cohesion protein solo isoform X1 [Drosophila sulfurigaster albostrigata]XP_062142943.1 sister chromatid cohesion protein solo isoform X1 [Drosophila sulfurigaster albostrigata]